MNLKSLSTLGLAALLTGCTMAPKYERPEAPVNTNWPVAVTNQGTNAVTADIDWHVFFEDPRLQQLIALALENNRDLRIAALRVEQSRAQYRIERAALLPGVEGNATYIRQKFSSAVTAFNGGNVLDTYSLSVGASYEVDLFGRVRSLKREALEKYFATDEARKAAQIAIVSEVASQYLTLLRYRQAKAIGQQTLDAVQASYELNKKSFEAGAASELELRTSEAQVQTAKVNIAGYAQLLAQAYNSFVELLGQPIPVDTFTNQTLAQQHFMPDLPAGVPSEVLQRRPDVLAAEHTLKAANADIGAARAAFFPRILLTGAGGTSSAKLTDLFTPGSETWNFSPQITVPIFDLGNTRGKLDVAKVTKRIEIANYEKTIQTAFREVADALAVRAILEERIKSQALLLEAQQRRFDLTTARYKQGVDNYVDVLLAQQDLYAAQQTLLQFQAARLVNYVTLYRSLGGGWTEAADAPDRHPSF